MTSHCHMQVGRFTMQPSFLLFLLLIFSKPVNRSMSSTCMSSMLTSENYYIYSLQYEEKCGNFKLYFGNARWRASVSLAVVTDMDALSARFFFFFKKGFS